MQRQDAHPGLQQPLDQHPVGPLDRDHLNPKTCQRRAQRAHAVLVVRERRRQQLLTGWILDQHVVLLRSPIDPRAITHRYLQRSDDSTAPQPGGTVAGAHRQGPQPGATSCRRSRHLTTVGTGWSPSGPPHKGKQKWPSPDGGQGPHRLAYEQKPRRGPGWVGALILVPLRAGCQAATCTFGCLLMIAFSAHTACTATPPRVSGPLSDVAVRHVEANRMTTGVGSHREEPATRTRSGAGLRSRRRPRALAAPASIRRVPRGAISCS